MKCILKYSLNNRTLIHTSKENSCQIWVKMTWSQGIHRRGTSRVRVLQKQVFHRSSLSGKWSRYWQDGIQLLTEDQLRLSSSIKSYLWYLVKIFNMSHDKTHNKTICFYALCFLILIIPMFIPCSHCFKHKLNKEKDCGHLIHNKYIIM